MGEAVGQSLPIAVGVLVSPMPIVAVVLMLVSARARANGVAFVLGWIVGIAAVGSAVILLVGGAAGGDDGEPAVWVGILKLVLGLGLLLLAVRQWRGRPRAGVEPEAPKWMAAIDTFTPVKAFGLAFLLGGINPKNLLLVVSGATAIVHATDARGEEFAALAVFTVVASIGIVIPVLIYFVMGARAAQLLEGVRAWMVANNAVIMCVLLLVLGTKLVGDALTILA
ncbi:GAP family protein [Occultella glacieicola]|uniref:GAP family protein n=1 Tax=Occultella glacieicola TaxID=2518684 RepID=A0ABY2E5S9_9MICO|nr:GAP family protein [Occultella glacieicola]TDE95945.1 GAP family protein [Occultella glacieicola]